MASFSDDDTFEVETILEERKRKGILQYLVKWKEGESTWEPAERIAADCALAIEAFIKKPKTKSRRSSSRTRKSSRSRSRSQSRSAKGATKVVRKSSRSRSRGRQTEAAAKTVASPAAKTVASPAAKPVGSPAASSTAVREVIQTRRSLQKVESKTETANVKVVELKSSPATPPSSSSSSSTSVKASSSLESNSTDKSESQLGRVLRSSTMESRQKLEVQNVHNEQRPVREDDGKPRSAIWKIADYAVIVLFIVSLFAALFMFLEKFLDLESFKQQAFPSFETLSGRLRAGKDHLVDFFTYGWQRSADAWDYILEQVKQPVKASSAPTPASTIN